MVLLLGNEHPAHAGTHHGADAVRVLAIETESRVGHRFFGRNHGELGVAVDTLGVWPVYVLAHVEIVDLARHP